MHSAFNLLVILILCSLCFFNESAMCSLEKWHLRISIIIIIVIIINVTVIAVTISSSSDGLFISQSIFYVDCNHFCYVYCLT